LNSAREVRALQLHGARNALQRLELRTSLAVLALALGGLPATFLGANAQWPGDIVAALPMVAAFATTAAAGHRHCLGTWRGCSRAGRGAAQSMAAVLASLDAIDDALAVADGHGGLTRQQLRDALAAACPSLCWASSGEELTLLRYSGIVTGGSLWRSGAGLIGRRWVADGEIRAHTQN
jgi:hypothetical protein